MSPERRKTGQRKGRGQEDKGREGRRFWEEAQWGPPAVENSPAAVWVRGDQSHKSQLAVPPVHCSLSRFWGGGKATSSRFLVPSKWIQDRGGRKGVGWDAGKGTRSGVERARAPGEPQLTLTQFPKPQPNFIYTHCKARLRVKGQVPGDGRLGAMETVGCTLGLQEKRKVVVRMDSPSSSVPQAPRRPGAESR